MELLGTTPGGLVRLLQLRQVIHIALLPKTKKKRNADRRANDNQLHVSYKSSVLY